MSMVCPGSGWALREFGVCVAFTALGSVVGAGVACGGVSAWLFLGKG